MVDIKRRFSDLEIDLQKNYMTLNENSDKKSFREFIDKCDKVIGMIKEQLKYSHIPGRIKKSIQLIREQIFELKIRAKRQLDTKERKSARSDFEFVETESIFRNRIKTAFVINIEHIDLKTFLNAAKKTIINYIRAALNEHKCIKVGVVYTGIFAVKDREEKKVFNIKYEEMCLSTDLNNWFTSKLIETLLSDVEEFNERDSGWSMIAISNLAIHINKYNPMKGSSYIELPEWVKNKNAVVNVKSTDNDCFAWAVWSAICQINSKKHPDRLQSYNEHYSTRLKFKGIKFPVPIKAVPKFEKMNNISINIFMIEKIYHRFDKEEKILPVHLTKQERELHVNLLYVTDGENSHYCWIKNLSRLVSSQCSNANGKKYICNRCLHYFYSEQKLEAHKIDCRKMNDCAVTLPKPGENILKFKNFSKKLEVPFVILADTESYLGKVTSSCAPKTAYQEHKMFSIGYYLHCTYDDSLSRYSFNRGPNCAEWFSEELKQIADQVDKVKI